MLLPLQGLLSPSAAERSASTPGRGAPASAQQGRLCAITPASAPAPPQTLGLTNYSIWPEAGLGRACVATDPAARQALLGEARRRLEGMKHVGLTEKLDESVLSLAASLGERGDALCVLCMLRPPLGGRSCPARPAPPNAWRALPPPACSGALHMPRRPEPPGCRSLALAARRPRSPAWPALSLHEGATPSRHAAPPQASS